MRWSICIICSVLFIQSCELDKKEEPDDDGDGVANAIDICPDIPNSDQADDDDDGIGNACEADTDEDGVIDDLDNCPTVPNADQADANDDGIGDTCEGDKDEDGVPDFQDNCPEIANPEQADFDNDGVGDFCDETLVSEDKKNIESSLNMTFNCARDLKNGKGIDLVMEDMLAFSNGEFGDDVWVDAITEKLSNDLFEGVDGEGISLYLSQVGGVYTFSKADSSWTQSSSSTTRIELQFPSNQDESSNNASLILDNYSDQELTIDAEVYELPTSAELSLIVDDVELMAISINEVIYGKGDLPIPSKVDIEIFLKPTTFHIVLESSSDTAYAIDLGISGEDGCTLGVGLEVELAHNDFENIILEEDIESLTAEVRMEHMSIVTASDLATVFGLVDPTEAQINELFDLDLLINDFKIADVEFNQEEEALYLIFKDDTKEDAFNYFENFFNDMLGLVEDYTGELFGDE